MHEHEVDAADPQRVTRQQRRLVDAPAVHVRAVRALEVFDFELPVGWAVRRQCRRDTIAASTMKSARTARPSVLMVPGMSLKVSAGSWPWTVLRIHMVTEWSD